MDNLIEQAEVILCNLIALSDTDREQFVIPHDDVLVSLKTAVRLLQEAQEEQSISTGQNSPGPFVKLISG